MSKAFDQFKSYVSKRFETFHSQDVENGFFDVVFQIGDKKLHAHKHMLASISKPFAVMFSERWSNKDEQSIKIYNYSFDDFNEFLNHFYFAVPKLNNDNIFTMVDMAEFYDVADMKVPCEEFLATIVISPENVLEMFEFSHKYSLVSKFRSTVKSFMIQNLSSLLSSDDFMNIKKEILQVIVNLQRPSSKEEELFEAVYKWAEHQALIKQSSTENETVDINQMIKDELADILPKISFARMDIDFLIEFVVPKGFLFSYQCLSDILYRSKHRAVCVKVIDENGKTLSGKISCDASMLMDTYDAIIWAKMSTVFVEYQCWNTKRSRPSKPSLLKKKDNVAYYLIFDADGDLAVKINVRLVDADYLLAELAVEDGFMFDKSCQIEAVLNF